MSKILSVSCLLVFLCMVLYGKSFAQEIQKKAVNLKYLLQYESGVLKSSKNVEDEGLIFEWNKQDRTNHYGAYNYAPKNKGEHPGNKTFDSPKLDSNFNQTIQLLSSFIAKENKYSQNSQLAIDEEVEMDGTIYMTFNEKERKDGFKRTVPEKNPYAVLIYVSFVDETLGGLVCSGTLLSSLWVLTAAHCFDKDLKKVTVYAGGSSLTELVLNKVPKSAQLKEATYYKHLRYDKSRTIGMQFDVAVLKVNEEFKMTSTVNTAKLSKRPWTHDKYKACMITAFGKVDLSKYPNEDDYTRKTHYFEVKRGCPCVDMKGSEDVLMCSRPREDYGLCSGDSGAGLICNGLIVAIALTMTEFHDINNCSYKSTEHCGLKNTITIFQEAVSFLDWVNYKVSSASTNHSFHLVVIFLLIIFFIRSMSFHSRKVV